MASPSRRVRRPIRDAALKPINYHEDSNSDPDDGPEPQTEGNDSPYRGSPTPLTVPKRRSRPLKQSFGPSTPLNRTPLRRVQSASAREWASPSREPSLVAIGPLTNPYSIPKLFYSGWRAEYEMPVIEIDIDPPLEDYVVQSKAIMSSEAPPYFKAMAQFRLGEKLDEQTGNSVNVIHARRCYERAIHYLQKAQSQGNTRDPTMWDTDARWEQRLVRCLRSAMQKSFERVRAALEEHGLPMEMLRTRKALSSLLVDWKTGEDSKNEVLARVFALNA